MLEAMMQVVALCAHGNAFVTQRNSSLDAFGAMPFFASVESFAFFRNIQNQRSSVIASLPSAWLRRLQNEDCKGLRFCFDRFDYRAPLQAPVFRKFAGLLCEGNAGIELWTPEWRYRGLRNDGKNWKVSYASERVGRQFFNPPTTVEMASSNWQKALAGFLEIMKRQGRTNWVNRFETLLTLSSQSSPIPERYGDVLPIQGFAKETKLLVADVMRTQIMLASQEYVELRESGSLDANWMDAERTVWRSIGGAYESALFAQEKALEIAA